MEMTVGSGIIGRGSTVRSTSDPTAGTGGWVMQNGGGREEQRNGEVQGNIQLQTRQYGQSALLIYIKEKWRDRQSQV